MTDQPTPPQALFEVIGEIYECNFENEAFTVVSFSVPIETRWTRWTIGKYKIVRIEEK